MDQPKKNYGFCTACGAPLSGVFCSSCGAKAASAPVEAVPAAEAPVVEAPVVEAPVVEAPVVEAAPAPGTAPASAAPKKSFPLFPVIGAGLAAFMATFNIFGSLTGFVTCAALAAIIVGMIIGRQKKNLFVAIGFFALGGCGLLDSFIGLVRNVSYGQNAFVALLVFVLTAIGWLCDAGLGLMYLFAKPKFTVLKTLASAVAVGFAFLMMIIALIANHGYGAGLQIFGFLLYSLPLYAAAILYTPWQK